MKTTLTPSRGASPVSSIRDITVYPRGVAKLLDGPNVHKASGLNGLNVKVLKECSNETSLMLAFVFNKSLTRSDVPDDW